MLLFQTYWNFLFPCAVDSDNLWMQHLMFCAFPLFFILKKIEKPFLLRLFILVTCQPRIGTTKLLPIFKIRLWLNEYAFMTLVCACFRSAQKLLFITYLHIHSGCILKNFFDIFMFYMLIFKLSCNHAMIEIVAIIIPILQTYFQFPQAL